MDGLAWFAVGFMAVSMIFLIALVTRERSEDPTPPIPLPDPLGVQPWLDVIAQMGRENRQAVADALAESGAQNLELMRVAMGEMRQLAHGPVIEPDAQDPTRGDGPDPDYPIELNDPGLMDWTDGFITDLGLGGPPGSHGLEGIVPAPPPELSGFLGEASDG